MSGQREKQQMAKQQSSNQGGEAEREETNGGAKGSEETPPFVADRQTRIAPAQAGDVAKPRADSFKCPKCGGFGCPAQVGKVRGRHGFTRHRKCSNPKCGHAFATHEAWVAGSVTAGCGTETVKA
jgi:hypothetical protein